MRLILRVSFCHSLGLLSVKGAWDATDSKMEEAKGQENEKLFVLYEQATRVRPVRSTASGQSKVHSWHVELSCQKLGSFTVTNQKWDSDVSRRWLVYSCQVGWSFDKTLDTLNFSQFTEDGGPVNELFQIGWCGNGKSRAREFAGRFQISHARFLWPMRVINFKSFLPCWNPGKISLIFSFSEPQQGIFGGGGRGGNSTTTRGRNQWRIWSMGFTRTSGSWTKVVWYDFVLLFVVILWYFLIRANFPRLTVYFIFWRAYRTWRCWKSNESRSFRWQSNSSSCSSLPVHLLAGLPQ